MFLFWPWHDFSSDGICLNWLCLLWLNLGSCWFEFWSILDQLVIYSLKYEYFKSLTWVGYTTVDCSFFVDYFWFWFQVLIKGITYNLSFNFVWWLFSVDLLVAAT
jgi:hypothetical protein